jgi:hypothetical protein
MAPSVPLLPVLQRVQTERQALRVPAQGPARQPELLVPLALAVRQPAPVLARAQTARAALLAARAQLSVPVPALQQPQEALAQVFRQQAVLAWAEPVWRLLAQPAQMVRSAVPAVRAAASAAPS